MTKQNTTIKHTAFLPLSGSFLKVTLKQTKNRTNQYLNINSRNSRDITIPVWQYWSISWNICITSLLILQWAWKQTFSLLLSQACSKPRNKDLWLSNIHFIFLNEAESQQQKLSLVTEQQERSFKKEAVHAETAWAKNM